eukprot:UN25611
MTMGGGEGSGSGNTEQGCSQGSGSAKEAIKESDAVTNKESEVVVEVIDEEPEVVVSEDEEIASVKQGCTESTEESEMVVDLKSGSKELKSDTCKIDLIKQECIAKETVDVKALIKQEITGVAVKVLKDSKVLKSDSSCKIDLIKQECIAKETVDVKDLIKQKLPIHNADLIKQECIAKETVDVKFEQTGNYRTNKKEAGVAVKVLKDSKVLKSDSCKMTIIRRRYESLLELNPEDSKTHYKLAYILKSHYKDYKLARDHFELAIENNPTYAKAHRNLGVLCHKFEP